MQNGRKCRFWFGTSQVLADDQDRGDEWYEQQIRVIETCILDAGPSWFVGQFERGESGRAHLQFAVYFKHARSLQSVGGLDVWPQRPHLEPVKGSVEDCVKYCTKDDGRLGSSVEVGDRPAQGKRSDLIAIYRLLREEGKTVRHAADLYPGSFMRYGRAFHTARYMFKEPEVERNCILFYGATRTFKSRNAAYVLGERPFYDHFGWKWWDGYEGEDIVIFDDFDWTQVEIRAFLKLAEYRPMRGQTKGAHVSVGAKWYIFTSNEALELWWEGSIQGPHREALEERFKYIIHLTDVVTFDKGSEQAWKDDGFKPIKNKNQW